jgi:hypothetical protein
MDGQRRGESLRRCRGSSRRLVGVALAWLLILPAAACDSEPTGTQRPLDHSGIGSGDTPTQQLVGTWRTVVVVQVPGDVQTWTTTWRFGADNSCLQTVAIESLAEGFPRVTERPCTFTAGDFEITIAFVGGGTLVFEYAFADFSPDRLILDGFEYQRLA